MADASPNFIIRQGQERDIIPYLQVCQRSAQAAYSSHSELFAPHHYFHPGIMPYWRELARNDEVNRWWVAESADTGQGIIGGIALKSSPDRHEGRGFYVDPGWQGMGIGRALWQTRNRLINRPLYFEVYSKADSTIAFHERHGAVKTGRQRLIHWDSWPDNTYLTALEFVSQ